MLPQSWFHSWSLLVGYNPQTKRINFYIYCFLLFWAIPCDAHELLLAMRSKIAPGWGTIWDSGGIEPRSVHPRLACARQTDALRLCATSLAPTWVSYVPKSFGDTVPVTKGLLLFTYHTVSTLSRIRGIQVQIGQVQIGDSVTLTQFTLVKGRNSPTIEIQATQHGHN